MLYEEREAHSSSDLDENSTSPHINFCPPSQHLSDHVGRDLLICGALLHPYCCDEVVGGGTGVSKKS